MDRSKNNSASSLCQNDKTGISRRQFGQSASALAAGVAAVASPSLLPQPSLLPVQDNDVSLDGRIYKTLKIGMVKVKGSLTEKFKAVKEAGFAGIEMDSPGMNIGATNLAIKESGLPVDGTVCSTHWAIRHSSPDAEMRKKALADLKTSIRDTHAVGGNTALLVIGHGQDGSPEEIWKRSIENISLALPLCAELGVYIAIENVWNKFLYDHNGDSGQSAEQFVKFVDELNSPWVGMQFDIGNHWKYGSMGDWIRQLGRRVVKLDLKGFSRANNKFTKIGEGDLDWADVRKALKEINYVGWAAAEVGGGDLARLKEVSTNMDKVFKLGEFA